MAAQSRGDAKQARLRREQKAATRERLLAAMTRVAAEKGYRRVRVAEVAEAAGVSRMTFYSHFADKHDCLEAAFDRWAEAIYEGVEGAVARASGGPKTRAEAGLRELGRRLKGGGGVAQLVTVEIRAGGPSCQLAQRRWLKRLEGLADDVEQPDSPEAKAALGELTSLRALGVDSAEAVNSPQLLREARRLGREAAARREEAQRELLLGAMAKAAAKGYEAVRVEDVLELSALSRSTFYAHFGGKEECFLAAFDVAAARMIEAVGGAAEPDASAAERARAGLDALLGLLAAEPALARLATIEIRAAGEPGQRRYEEALGRFAEVIEEPGKRAEAEASAGVAMPRMIVGAAANMIGLEVGAGRTAELEGLLPDLVFTVLTPCLGAKAARAEMAVRTADSRPKPRPSTPRPPESSA